MRFCCYVMLACLLPYLGAAQSIDILLKGGHVIDPKNKIDANVDVGIAGGRICKVAANIPADSAKKVIDVTGMYVTPGIIDMHVHVFHGTDAGSYLASGFHGLPADGFS